jgi:hypothetical protein
VSRSSKISSAHREALATYVKAGRHLTTPDRAKTIKAIAAELGISRSTARHWLRRDHNDEWMEYWPTVEDLFAESERERNRKNQPPAAATTPLHLPSPDSLVSEFDPDEDEFYNAQRFAAYRQHRQGQRLGQG